MVSVLCKGDRDRFRFGVFVDCRSFATYVSVSDLRRLLDRTTTTEVELAKEIDDHQYKKLNYLCFSGWVVSEWCVSLILYVF